MPKDIVKVILTYDFTTDKTTLTIPEKYRHKVDEAVLADMSMDFMNIGIGTITTWMKKNRKKFQTLQSRALIPKTYYKEQFGVEKGELEDYKKILTGEIRCR